MAEYYVWQKGDKGKLTRNFNMEEFTCKGTKCGCTTQKINKQLVEQLQTLRQLCGALRVTSAYRCVIHNRSIGSKDTSKHVAGCAVDVQPIGDFLAPTFKGAMVKLLQQVDHMDLFQGVGVNSRFLHLDLRSKAARWNY